MAGWLRRTFLEPDIGKYLLREEGEVIVDMVRRHWIVYVRPVLEAILGLGFVAVFLFSSLEVAWLPLLAAVSLFLHAAWLERNEHMDRFVITDKRVFRVTGLLAKTFATMPLRRILDIAMQEPLIGRVTGYGHFVFESAAQEQGLRKIKFVGNPAERQRVIQRLVQQRDQPTSRLN